MSSEDYSDSDGDRSPTTIYNFDFDDDELSEILSPYEMERKPIATLGDISCSVDGSSLTQGTLICPICLSILRNVRTVMKCLHRFCELCIVDALRKGKKECPTCRTKLPSHRGLRPEPRIDFLLGSLLGDLDKWEREHDSALEKLTETINMKALRESVSKGMQRQSTASKRKRKLPDALLSSMICIELKEHPNMKNVASLTLRKYVQTEDNILICFLIRYLHAQLQVKYDYYGDQFIISLYHNATGEKITSVEDLDTLADIRDKQKKQKSDVVLYYSILPST